MTTMNTRNKIAGAIAVAALATFGLVGCGDGGNGDANASNNSNSNGGNHGETLTIQPGEYIQQTPTLDGTGNASEDYIIIAEDGTFTATRIDCNTGVDNSSPSVGTLDFESNMVAFKPHISSDGQKRKREFPVTPTTNGFLYYDDDEPFIRVDSPEGQDRIERLNGNCEG